MKVTLVQYSVRPDYVELNKLNIEAVMRELRSIGHDGVEYAVYLRPDGRTFMHFVRQNTVQAEQYPTSLESFRTFQAQLRPNLEVPPTVEALTLVDLIAQGADRHTQARTP